MRTKNLVALLLVFSILMLTACSGEKKSSGEASSSGSGDSNQIKIGVSYQNLQNEYIVNVQKAVQAQAKSAGVKLIEADGQGKSEKQISQVENFITQGVNAIILNPFDKNGAAAAVEKAKAAGIPIITLTAVVANQDQVTAHVGSNDEEAGVIEMKQIAQLLNGKGKIAVIHGPFGHSAEVGRTKGIKQVLKDYPDIKVVSEQTANWSREEALNLVENWLQTLKLDAIVAQNDEMALGALKAVEANGKFGKIKIIGIDAIPDALDSVKNGKLDGSVFQDAKGQGATAVDVAIKAAKGEKVEKTNYIPFQLITKENVDKFIGQ